MQICIAGGDTRAVFMAELFAKSGYRCVMFGFDNNACQKSGIEFAKDIAQGMQNSAAVILPYPCKKDGFLNTPCSGRRIETDSVFAFDDGKRLFLGGGLPYKGENVIDYSAQEDFLWYNAVPTAEGAVAIAMEELDTTVYGAEITVVGYGRIGSYLTHILQGLGAKVTVVARNRKSRASAEVLGASAVGFEEIEAPLSCADLVFNTVPAKVISHRELKILPSGTAIIDLASLPGGAGEKECLQYGIKLIRALGLPGRVAPAFAGEALFKTILPILKSRGITP